MSDAPRCLIWVQSLLGSGHLRRALTLAGALAADGLAVTLANGGPPSPWPAPRGVGLVQLPSLTTPDAGFTDLVAADGSPAGPDVWRARRDALAGLLAERSPAVLITEMFPFGRRAFRNELLPFLAQAGSLRPRPLVLASVRDVLVSKREPARYRWMLDVFAARYDAVLVHGDAALFPFRLSFPLAGELGAGKVLHTGFVLTRPPPAETCAAGPVPAVVVSAGGGAVGAGLLRTALGARPLTRFASDRWLLVAGSNLPPASFAALADLVAPPVTLVRHSPDLPVLMAAAEVSVSQAGYNTVAEGLAGGARMVLVPFAAPGEDEQTRRAARLASLGLAAHLREAGLDAHGLAAAVDRAAGMPRPDPRGIAFDGAARTAALVRGLLARHADA